MPQTKTVLNERLSRILFVLVFGMFGLYYFLVPAFGRSVGLCNTFRKVQRPQGERLVNDLCWCDGVKRQSKPASWIEPCRS